MKNKKFLEKEKETKNKVLIAKELYKKVNNKTILENVSFSLKKGEFLGVFGENGCGKSTFLSTLTGLTKLDKGSIIFYDKKRKEYNIKNPLDVRKFFGYGIQNHSLFENFSVLDNLKLILSGFGFKDEKIINRINELLKFLNIEEIKNYKIKNLPIGAKKKVDFLVSIAHKPLIIFFDEPFAGLDFELRKEFLEIFVKLKKKGYAIIITSNLDKDFAFCDKILFIRNGKWKIIKETKNIYGEYKKFKGEIK